MPNPTPKLFAKMTIPDGQKPPHVALLPSAGMGHLAPFCRLAAALSNRGCDISFITARPTVSSAESLRISDLLDSFPTIRSLNLPLVDLHPSQFPPATDPFFLRFEAIRRSAHLLSNLHAASSLPISALLVDISLASAFVPILNRLHLPCYLLFTSSAAMLSLCAYFPTHLATKNTNYCFGDIDIPGLTTVPLPSIPPPLRDPNHLFTVQFVENAQIIQKSAGILINTFHALEPDALAALRSGQVIPHLPPVFDIGPFRPLHNQLKASSPVVWLDKQPQKSVVYVSFGSRTAMPADQIKEVAGGLERSGQRFLWVIKTKKVDREEGVEVDELVGEGYIERVMDRGLVVSGWVEQEEILNHPAVGGFVSHCGWNSVTEAAMAGTRVLGWPRGGDQRVNGEVVRRSGLGVWMEEWSWEAEGGVVTAEVIATMVKEMMEDEVLRQSAERVGEEARRAVDAGGSSDKGLGEFIAKLML